MAAANIRDAHVVIVHAFHVVHQVGAQQPHEKIDFGFRTPQIVLEREGVQR